MSGNEDKDEDGKNKLRITAGSMKHSNKQRWYETVVAQLRSARPTPLVGQANSSLGQSAQLTHGVSQAESSLPSIAKSAKLTVQVSQADSLASCSFSASGVHVLCTFVPPRPEIGT